MQQNLRTAIHDTVISINAIRMLYGSAISASEENTLFQSVRDLLEVHFQAAMDRNKDTPTERKLEILFAEILGVLKEKVRDDGVEPPPSHD